MIIVEKDISIERRRSELLGYRRKNDGESIMGVAEIRTENSSAPVLGADQPGSVGTVRKQLLASIEALREIVEGSAKDAELERTMPERAWAAMDKANLVSLKAPRELGGLEADPMLQMEALERMAYFDSSAGWTLMVGAGVQFIAGGWAPEEALDLIFDGRKMRRGAIALAPSGKATPVDGGYKLSGRWQFASGIRHAEWVVAGAMLQDTAEFMPFRAFLLPVGAGGARRSAVSSGRSGRLRHGTRGVRVGCRPSRH